MLFLSVLKHTEGDHMQLLRLRGHSQGLTECNPKCNYHSPLIEKAPGMEVKESGIILGTTLNLL